MKRYFKLIIIILILWLMMVWWIYWYLTRNHLSIKYVEKDIWFVKITPESFNIALKDQWWIDGSYEDTFNVQSKNSCGPYSIAYALKLLDVDIDPELISTTISWRKTPQSITFPPWIEDYISRIAVQTDFRIWFNSINLGNLSDIYKVLALQTLIQDWIPVIVLVEYQWFQHYVTVVWYSRLSNTIYVYNPLKKDNDEWPWNESISETEFLQMRSKWWQYGLYQRYGVAIYDVTNQTIMNN